MSYLGNPTLPRSCHSQGRDVEAGSSNHCSPLKKRGHCFLGQELVMTPHGSCCPWLSTYSPETFPSPGTFSASGPSPGGEIKGEYVRKRRGQPTPSSGVEKVRGRTDTYGVLGLLPL